MTRTFKILSLGAVLLFATEFSLIAQVSIVDSIESAGSITIDQPAALARLLVFKNTPAGGDTSGENHAVSVPSTTRTGYRVQIFDDNNPRTARSLAESANRRVQADFPELRSYLSFNSPYWRVKVGDFRTRAEAEAAMAEIRQAMPDLKPYLRVMRDKINVID